jgi:hypothetical protein
MVGDTLRPFKSEEQKMATYNEQMQRIFDRYRKEVYDAPTMLDQVYTWAVENELWEASEESKRKQLQRGNGAGVAGGISD